jgi:two-component system response regulator PilR (NtrC family)
MAQIEKHHLLAALRACEGVRTHAAELLRMSYRSFRHYAKKYDI